MNFFEHQDHARRQTRTLVILFVLAVIAIIATVNAALALVWAWSKGLHMSGAFAGTFGYPRHFFLTNSLITLGMIGGGTALEIWNLRDGGEAVADMAGGRLVMPSSMKPAERRLLNVVEEMAIASGIACPKVYVLDREDAINAFAAGYNPNEAVVCVTRGVLERLTRDELQGVIGHEFSHILNGDMRLNVRLIGVLFGIQMLAGFGHHLIDFARYAPLDSRGRNDKAPSVGGILFITGIVLVVVGYIGVLFGRLIKAAVSRQREYLADASAVQFTRNPDGIGGALRKIGGLPRSERSMKLGSRITHPNAEQLSHLFLGAVKPSLLSGLFATHPPLEERLRRIYGRKVDLLDAPVLKEESAPATVLPDIPFVATGFAGGAINAANAADATLSGHPGPAATAIAFGTSTAEQVPLAPQLDSALRDPQSACAVVYALLLGQGDERRAQLAMLDAATSDESRLVAYLADTIAALPKSARLPLLDLAMPSLRQLAQPARDDLLGTVEKLIAADNRVTLAEFVLQTVLYRRLDAKAGRATPVRYPTVASLGPDAAVLLSVVAHVTTASDGTSGAAQSALARGAPIAGIPAGALIDVPQLAFERVRRALDAANLLAPLAKPILIKALLAVAGTNELPLETADLLRAICAAIDVPVPAPVSSTYTACAWSL